MKLIIACTPTGGVGYKNQLPWNHIKDDLTRFKQLTQNQVVVMGKNTWLSLPNKPLPSRLNFVVTRNPLDLPNNVVAVKDLSPFENFPNSWLIGGADLLNSSWDYIDEVHLTLTYDHYDCDKFINLSYLERNFIRVSVKDYTDHSYEIWKRNNGTVSRFT
jgi:dihydrofolate reductase